MKLGTFMMPVHPPEKSRTACMDEDTQFVVDGEKLGFTEVWCGHHVTLEWEPIVANDLFLANLIARTHSIKLGVGVSIMPQHHPANVAARIALLDHLSHGRVYWGFGQGGVPTDWELFGLPDSKTQNRMTREAYEIVMMLWTQDPPFKHEGEFWKVGVEKHHDPKLKMGYPLRPFQKPHPPIAMTLVSGESKGGQVGGRLGHMPLSTNLVHHSTVARHWKTYCEGAAAAGRGEPDRDIWRVARSVYIGETHRAAWDHALHGAFGRSFEYLIALLRRAEMLHLMKHDESVSDDEVTVEYAMKNVCIIGDKASVKDQLDELWEVTGGFGTFLLIKHDFDDLPRWQRCIEILAHEIVPAMPDVAAMAKT
jgi:alkanesulfonate monooxygenase SsuD/methylene tetrahydromethanopterin reductase-like flavin-dependent oxidoreductase (luciferase family)